MTKKVKFGLIGRDISYSFSQQYFEEKFEKLELTNYSYSLFDLQNLEEVNTLFQDIELKGFNVTIPYKEAIIPYLDELSPEAENIGAVNCIIKFSDKKIGYNTDAFGFEKTLLTYKTDQQKSAIVIGNGGAAKAVKYIFKKHNIPFVTIARKSELNFENLNPEIIHNNLIIVQCTPVGTFPNVENCLPFPFEAITSKHLAIDLIYNPTETLFLKNCRLQGAKTINGQLMLEQQAEKAWEIWNFK